MTPAHLAAASLYLMRSSDTRHPLGYVAARNGQMLACNRSSLIVLEIDWKGEPALLRQSTDGGPPHYMPYSGYPSSARLAEILYDNPTANFKEEFDRVLRVLDILGLPRRCESRPLTPASAVCVDLPLYTGKVIISALPISVP